MGTQYLDTSNEDNQQTLNEYQRSYSNERVYSSIFDDDDSEDLGDISNTSNSNLITSRGAYNRHTDVRISRSGSIYLDLKNAVHGENDAGSVKRLPVILIQSSMKRVYIMIYGKMHLETQTLETSLKTWSLRCDFSVMAKPVTHKLLKHSVI